MITGFLRSNSFSMFPLVPSIMLSTSGFLHIFINWRFARLNMITSEIITTWAASGVAMASNTIFLLNCCIFFLRGTTFIIHWIIILLMCPMKNTPLHQLGRIQLSFCEGRPKLDSAFTQSLLRLPCKHWYTFTQKIYWGGASSIIFSLDT